MDPLLDLNACFLWCLDKFSHCLQQTHCNSPPRIFGITFIAAISSYTSPLFCCRRVGHTNMHPVLCSLKSVCKGKRGDSKHPGSWQFPPCPCCPAGAGGSCAVCTHLQLQKPLRIPSLVDTERIFPSSGWASLQEQGRISQMIQKS